MGISYNPKDLTYKEMKVLDMIKSIKNQIENKEISRAEREMNKNAR